MEKLGGGGGNVGVKRGGVCRTTKMQPVMKLITKEVVKISKEKKNRKNIEGFLSIQKSTFIFMSLHSHFLFRSMSCLCTFVTSSPPFLHPICNQSPKTMASSHFLSSHFLPFSQSLPSSPST